MIKRSDVDLASTTKPTRGEARSAPNNPNPRSCLRRDCDGLLAGGRRFRCSSTTAVSRTSVETVGTSQEQAPLVDTRTHVGCRRGQSLGGHARADVREAPDEPAAHGGWPRSPSPWASPSVRVQRHRLSARGTRLVAGAVVSSALAVDTMSITIWRTIHSLVVVLVPSGRSPHLGEHRGRVRGDLSVRLPRQPLSDRAREGARARVRVPPPAPGRRVQPSHAAGRRTARYSYTTRSGCGRRRSTCLGFMRFTSSS
jgi:hypothetical protein